MNHWSKEEDSILRLNYRFIPLSLLQQRLLPNRSNISIKHRASRLGLANKTKISVEESNLKLKTRRKEHYIKSRAKDIRVSMISDARRRAKKNNVEFSITLEDIVIPTFCPLLGILLKANVRAVGPNSPSLDRLIPSLGYTKNNIWVISHRANKIKNDASIHELEAISERLRSYSLINKKDTIDITENKFKQNILVIGENCKDGWIDSKVRLNAEAPTCVVNPISEKYNAGMAGNVVSNLKTLGNLNIDFLTQSNIISKVRYIDARSNYIIVRIDTNDKAEELDLDIFYKKAEKVKLDAIVISDYNKGFLSEDLLKTIINFSFEKKIPVFVDSKKIIGDWAKNAFVVKINEKEYNDNLNNNSLLPCKNLIVTRGKEGSTLINKNFTVKSSDLLISNVCGCGDTYLAALVAEFLKEKSLEKAMIFANDASTFVASKRDVYSPTRKEIDDFKNRK